METKLVNGRAGCVKRDGFTLVELLVVIAIITILAALLFPAFSRAKAAAQSVKCKSNLHHMGVAVTVYIADHRAYPTYGTQVGINDFAMNWKQQLSPYLANTLVVNPSRLDKEVFKCPTLYSETKALGTDTSRAGPNESYGYNLDGVGGSRSGDTFDGTLGLGGWIPSGGIWLVAVREAKVKSPADMLAFGDAFVGAPEIPVQISGPIIGINWGPSVYQEQLPYFPYVLHTAAERHRGRLNMVFCDAHVESPRTQNLFSLKDDASLSRWNSDHLPHRELISANP